MLKAIIHDLDGMLISGERFSDAYVKEFGIDSAAMREFFDGPYKECITGRTDLKEELAKGWPAKWGWSGSLDELLEYWWKQGAKPNIELIDAIREVRVVGTPCFIATNQEKYRIAFLKRTLDLGNRFDHVFVSSELSCKKPETAFFDHIMEYLNRDTSVVPHQVMFWDDKPDYIESGRAYGFRSYVFTNTDEYLQEVERQKIL